jgi:hypothetical protein
LSSEEEQNDEEETENEREDGQNGHGGEGEGDEEGGEGGEGGEGEEGEGEGEGSLGLVPSPGRFMTVKEMRLALIDEIYTEAQLRMLAEGCAIVDGIPSEAYAYPLLAASSL